MPLQALRALQDIIAKGLDDIERIYSTASNKDSAAYDFPSLDIPGDSSSPAEKLTTHPEVAAAISLIVSAATQLTASVRAPFLSLCDAGTAVCAFTKIVLPARAHTLYSTIYLHACASVRPLIYLSFYVM